MFFRLKIFMMVVLFLSSVFLFSCSGLQKRIRALGKTNDKELNQMRAAGFEFAELLANHLRQDSCKIPAYVALLSSKVDSRKELPIANFEDELVRFLMKKQIYVVRRENRKKKLKQIYRSVDGAGQRVSEERIGLVKAPDYFIQVNISEKYYFKGRTKIQERAYDFSFRSVVTQKIFFNKTIVLKRRIP